MKKELENSGIPLNLKFEDYENLSGQDEAEESQGLPDISGINV